MHRDSSDTVLTSISACFQDTRMAQPENHSVHSSHDHRNRNAFFLCEKMLDLLQYRPALAGFSLWLDTGYTQSLPTRAPYTNFTLAGASTLDTPLRDNAFSSFTVSCNSFSKTSLSDRV
jgi:hypothetical protein